MAAERERENDASARGPFTIVLDFDGAPIVWSGMWCDGFGRFDIRMDDETVRRHRVRSAPIEESEDELDLLY